MDNTGIPMPATKIFEDDIRFPEIHEQEFA